MKLNFYKYQGTGNDFIIIDNRSNCVVGLTTAIIAKICDRRFGVGADGLMLLENEKGFDFKMVYYNSDGNQSSMCGNGGRCIVEFARELGIIKDKTKFVAIDGEHEALIIKNGYISLKMSDVKNIETNTDFYFLNTGSPHYVKFVNNVEKFNVFEEGKKIRYNERFKHEGTNVNFIEKQGNALFVRTYERGVENETYSCGTGVTAAALIASVNNIANDKNHCSITTLGGNLLVKFERKSEGEFINIWLEGPAKFVFKGEIEI